MKGGGLGVSSIVAGSIGWHPFRRCLGRLHHDGFVVSATSWHGFKAARLALLDVVIVVGGLAILEALTGTRLSKDLAHLRFVVPFMLVVSLSTC